MKHLVVTMTLVVLAFTARTQNNFISTYSMLGTDEIGFENAQPGRCVRQLSDGSYLLIGISGDGFFLNKVDQSGQLTESKTLLLSGHSLHTEQFIETSNGDILIVGSSYSSSTFQTKTFITRISELSTVLWAKQYDAGIAFSAAESSNGDFAIVGQNMMLFVIDGTGNVVSTFGKRQFSGIYNGLDDIESTSDGGFIMCGQPIGSIGSFDAALIKTDENGTLQWHKVYGGVDIDWGGAGVVQTADGGYLMAGATRSFGVAPGITTDFYLIKTDAQGNLLWSKTYGTPEDDMARGVVVTPDGGFAVVGYTGPSSDFDAVIFKTDSLGNLQWARRYDDSIMDGASFIDITSDAGFVFTGGGINSFPWPAVNYLYKTSSQGIIPGSSCATDLTLVTGITATQVSSETTFNDAPFTGTAVTAQLNNVTPTVEILCQSSVAESYNCDPFHGCYDPGDGSGTFSTIGDCNLNCQDLSVSQVHKNIPSVNPNPATTALNFTGQFDGIEIYSLSGQLLHQNGFTNQLDITGYRSGVYLVKLSSGSNFWMHRVMIE